MSGMFFDNSSLVNLDLSSFDTSNVVNMVNTFHGLSSLKTLDLSKAKFDNVTSFNGMFSGISRSVYIIASGDTARTQIRSFVGDNTWGQIVTVEELG